jgi:hypothetical protein
LHIDGWSGYLEARRQLVLSDHRLDGLGCIESA